MRMQRVLVTGGFLVLVGLTLAWAGVFTASAPMLVSGVDPFAACTADNAATQVGTLFPASTVEPWVDVNPTNTDNIVAAWQQDRWSNAGARGLVAGVSTNGGASWTQVAIPNITACSAVSPTVVDYQRASDPWLSFAPNGDLYHVSLSLGIRPDGLVAPSALLVSKSTNGGSIWSNPITVIRDEPPTVLNDKQSITADPGNSSFVYLVWDRLESPNEQAPPIAFERALGFRGPTWFSRTTDGGTSWDAPRMIFDPGEINQTLGNQIVVLPNGTLVDTFNLIFNFKNAHQVRGFNVALLRSTDQGVTWSGPTIVDKLLSRALFDPQQIGVRDPDTGAAVRTGDIIPEVAVDRTLTSPGVGNLYLVWQDSRFSSFAHDSIAFSRSTDGGTTWSTPIQINKTPTSVRSGNQQAFTPAIHVASDGTVAVTYYDFRHDTPCPVVSGTVDCTGVPLSTDYFLVHCHRVSASCTSPGDWEEVQITTSSFDMRLAPVARGFFTGDYQALGVVGTAFKSIFVQAGPTAGHSAVYASTVGP